MLVENGEYAMEEVPHAHKKTNSTWNMPVEVKVHVDKAMRELIQPVIVESMTVSGGDLGDLVGKRWRP